MVNPHTFNLTHTPTICLMSSECHKLNCSIYKLKHDRQSRLNVGDPMGDERMVNLSQ